MRKKVLILSEAFGNGHTKAAEALAQVISLQEPSVQIHIIEIGKMLHPAINDLVLRIYKQSITTFSFLWKKYTIICQNRTIPLLTGCSL
ncbi:hypothetical protein [Paenibacillus cisolokensis]|uniref:hypothetical protein n=1 Tax=Paenibacillus cisolokensis TaxID=1658519 RepID=UPI001FD2F964|nr:hypothetical protein [Paenibacillus cisolokensis]